MSQQITLPKDVRVFRKTWGDEIDSLFLSRTERWIPNGTQITISEPRMMLYDHRDQLAVQVINDGQWDIEHNIFVIVDEIGNLNQANKN